MSVSLSGSCLPPSSTLIPIRKLITSSAEDIKAALKALQALYCPLRLPTIIGSSTRGNHVFGASTPSPVDSGYVSRDELPYDDNVVGSEEVTAALRADPFERAFATRWLTTLITQAEEIGLDKDATSSIIDDAAFILSSFADTTQDTEEEDLTREFSFPTASGNTIEVTLNDAPLSGTDHLDVGLQSWGASIVLSSMMSATPDHFGLTKDVLGDQPRIIELGAGTGLVSFTCAKLLPELGIGNPNITATDYHPAVLENGRRNVATNFPSHPSERLPVQITHLDWAQPTPDLRSTADVIIASDVIYAPEHASWLRDCAAHLLKPNGTFWLMATVRKTGKFEGIPETVESAFSPDLCPKDEDGRVFDILHREAVEKRRGIGRGDEAGYNLYRIGWA